MSKIFFHIKSCFSSKLSWKIVEWIAFLGLLLVTGFFVKKVLHEYSIKATSVKTYFEEHEKLDLPVIIMCFNPSINPFITQKYNASLHDILGFNDFESNGTIYEEGIYKIGRDFNITFDHGIGGNQKKEEITTLYTLVSGKCYKINPKHKMKERNPFNLRVTMREDLEFMPKMSFYFTSNQNSYHVITEDVKGTILYLETKPIGYYSVMLQKSEYKKLPEVSNCDPENIIPMECLSKRLD